MISLSEFTSKVRAKNRISFGDVQRLRRDVLPDGIGTRDDVELLMELDHDVARIDRAWERWLAAMIVDYVVWTERPTGIVNEETASWLVELLTASASLSRRGRLIAREIAEEAQAFENEALARLAASLSNPKSTRVAGDVEPARITA